MASKEKKAMNMELAYTIQKNNMKKQIGIKKGEGK